MDCGNGPVAKQDVLIRGMPSPLAEIVKRYQNARGLTSFRAAVIELIETHPRIAETVTAVYNSTKASPPEG